VGANERLSRSLPEFQRRFGDEATPRRRLCKRCTGCGLLIAAGVTSTSSRRPNAPIGSGSACSPPTPPALAHNPGNFPRTLATPEPIEDRSLTSLKEKLIEISAKVVSRGVYVAFEMAGVAIPRNPFADIPRLTAERRPSPIASAM
jgi:hypothetical protein